MKRVWMTCLMAMALAGASAGDEPRGEAVRKKGAAWVLEDLKDADLILACDYDEARGVVVKKVLRGYARPGDLWNAVLEKGPVLVWQRGGGADYPSAMITSYCLIGQDGKLATRDWAGGRKPVPMDVSLEEVEAWVKAMGKRE